MEVYIPGTRVVESKSWGWAMFLSSPPPPQRKYTSEPCISGDPRPYILPNVKRRRWIKLRSFPNCWSSKKIWCRTSLLPNPSRRWKQSPTNATKARPPHQKVKRNYLCANQEATSEVALCPLLPWYCVKLSWNIWFRDYQHIFFYLEKVNFHLGKDYFNLISPSI